MPPHLTIRHKKRKKGDTKNDQIKKIIIFLHYSDGRPTK